jgi:hypothetical protein
MTADTIRIEDLQREIELKGIRHFSAAEFLRGVPSGTLPGGFLPHALSILQQADRIREFMGSPLELSSGYRPAAMNKSVGGAPGSSHLYAAAVDLRVKRAWLHPSANEKLRLAGVLLWLGEPEIIGGLGIYAQNIHLDVRIEVKRRRAVWASTSDKPPASAKARMAWFQAIKASTTAVDAKAWLETGEAS